MSAMPASNSAFDRQEVLARSDPRFERLRAIIDSRSVMRGDFTLTSGAKSHYLFQLRQTTMFPEGQFLIGTIVEEFMRKIGVKTIGGPEMGAVPVVTAAAYASFVSGHPVDAFFVRKAAKSHGAQELVDGELKNGAEVLMVDDVTTTGGSIVKAMDSMATERKCRVTWALSIVDRDEGAAENLGRRGIALASIFTRSDFGL